MIDRAKSFIRAVVRGRQRPPGMEAIFSDIYRRNAWSDPESVSGRGSTLARTEVIRRTLPGLLESVGAKSLLDAPCGDFNWMQHVDLRGVEYIGADVVPEMIERHRRMYSAQGRSFVALDISVDEIPQVDVILCRDCFIHLSFESIQAAVANFKRSKSTFLLATTHTIVKENTIIQNGWWRQANLRLAPFNFPQPEQLIVEDPELGKCLGMWRLEGL